MLFHTNTETFASNHCNPINRTNILAIQLGCFCVILYRNILYKQVETNKTESNNYKKKTKTKQKKNIHQVLVIKSSPLVLVLLGKETKTKQTKKESKV